MEEKMVYGEWLVAKLLIYFSISCNFDVARDVKRT